MRTEAQIPCLPTSARRLDLYQVTLELIALCRPFGPRLKRFNRRLGAQLTEALAGALQNLAEAMRRTGSDRAHLLTVSLGSCEEVRALLEAAVAFGILSSAEQQRGRCAGRPRLRHDLQAATALGLRGKEGIDHDPASR